MVSGIEKARTGKLRKFPRSRAHIFGYLSITCHPYHLRAWNRLPPIPQFLFQTWPCGTSIVCLNLLSVLTFVRMKFLSLFLSAKCCVLKNVCEAFLSFPFQDPAFKNVRCFSRVDSPIKSSYGQCNPI